MTDYFKEHKNMHKLMERRREGFEEVMKRKKISIDDQMTINHYRKAVWDYWSSKYFALKKDDEPKHYQGSLLTESRKNYTQEQLAKIYKRNGYKCYTLTVPWFLVWDTYDRLSRKYFKGPAHAEEIEDTKEWCDFTDRFKTKEWTSPSKNPLYYWTKAWEYGVSPLEHTDVKEFMRARLKERKKYSHQVVEAKIKQKMEEEATQQQQRLEAERTEKLKKQEEIEKLRSKRYESIETVARDPAVYILCEKKKIFTKFKNKCNALYVGESLVFSSRASAYQHFHNPNNELVKKLVNKLKKPKDYIVQRIKDNVKIKVLRFKSMENNDHRKEIEGYLIKRLNPLINSSKRNGFYKRSFIEKKEDEGDYWEDVEDTFRTELYTFGDTETIYHVGKQDFVKRESVDGHEAMHIQFQRTFNTWVKKNNIKNRKDEWEEDPEAFYAGLTGLRDLWKYKKLKQEENEDL